MDGHTWNSMIVTTNVHEIFLSGLAIDWPTIALASYQRSKKRN